MNGDKGWEKEVCTRWRWTKSPVVLVCLRDDGQSGPAHREGTTPFNKYVARVDGHLHWLLVHPEVALPS